MFADDVSTVAKTVIKLKNQLNIVSDFCDETGMKLNLDKSKIMVFRRGGPLRHCEKWTFMGQAIEVVSIYKYLGTFFTPKSSWSKTQEILSLQANKAMNTIFQYQKHFGYFDNADAFKLFDSVVKPILTSSSLQEKVKSLNAEVERAKTDYIKQVEILSREKKTAQQTQIDLHEEIDKLKKETEKLSKEILEWKDDVSKLTEEKVNYKEEISAKEQELTSFQEAYKIEKSQFEKMIQEQDKKIKVLTVDKTRLTNERAKNDSMLGKHIKNTEHLENRVKELQQTNVNLHNINVNQSEMITTLGQQKEELEEEKKNLLLRLSKCAGANLTYQNPNIADLSDGKRPTKLAEEFSELYDNEWTDAFEKLDIDNDQGKSTFMLQLLKRANGLCNELSEKHAESIKKSFSTLTLKSRHSSKQEPKGRLNGKISRTTSPKPGTSTETDQDEAKGPRFDADNDDSIPKHETDGVKADTGSITTLTETDVDQITHLEAVKYSDNPKHGTKTEEAEKTEWNDHNIISNAPSSSGEGLKKKSSLAANDHNIISNALSSSGEGLEKKPSLENGNSMTDTADKGFEDAHGPALIQNTEPDIDSAPHSEADMDGNGPNTEYKNLEIVSANNIESLKESKENERHEEISTTREQGHERKDDEEPKQMKMKLESDFELLRKEQKKNIVEARKFFEVHLSEKVERAGSDIIVQELGIDQQKQETVVSYIQKCMNICWSMCRHEPPVHIEFMDVGDDIPFDTNKFKPYTQSGKRLDYVVWPAVYLHKDGPMLAKGVAQGKGKT
ncbi:uncharacterized protein LOC128553545 [Mercenaria mercenaria]|uniref:uncharacterized protein LOC128553545 n=1 Tax=Mercenaria mercenaria TaxID=6596 RepID=UPI00234F98F4|nr:uncharacterized protein LOC128553545 [Mercenaria mercenaria]